MLLEFLNIIVSDIRISMVNLEWAAENYLLYRFNVFRNHIITIRYIKINSKIKVTVHTQCHLLKRKQTLMDSIHELSQTLSLIWMS